MNLLSPATLASLTIETLRSPRATFSRLMSLDLPREALWQSLLLVVIVSVIVAEFTALLLTAPGTTMDVDNGGAATADGPILASPMVFGLIQLVLLVATVILIDRVGRAMGGKGRFEDAILTVVWLQFIMFVLQLAQGLAIAILPGLAGLVLIVGIGVFLWLLTAFTAETHSFESQGRVFAMILFVLMGVALGLSFFLSLIGVTVSR